MKNDAKNIILWIMIPLFLIIALVDFYATKKTNNYTNERDSSILKQK